MLPLDQDFLTNAIVESTCSVFGTMLDSAVLAGTPEVDAKETAGGLVALVGLTGPWNGTGSICCAPQVAGRLAAKFLMMDPAPESEAVTDEVMDAMAELTNMIIGNIKHLVEERVGSMAITIPMVVFGRNFQFKRLGGNSGLSVPFQWEDDRVDVRLCLVQSSDKPPFARGRAEAFVLEGSL